MLDKTYRPSEVEERIYRLWEEGGWFRPRPREGSTPYCIMMPPPNVTGSLHMGHALTFTIQDTLIRYHRMRGREVLWQPGTDHAGIATQLMVERKLAREGRDRRSLGREAFLAEVWRWKEESGGQIARQLRRLGASADWSRERFTLDPGLSRAVITAFVRLYKDGLIYRDKRLVNWDCALKTALSDLEVQMVEVRGQLWYIRYPVEGEQGRHVVVATTRPETMLGDTAVAVHPEDERYRDLVGRHLILPLVGRRLPVVADTAVDPAFGTGAVKVTPAHDFADFEIGRRHGLPMVPVLDEEGRLNDNAPEAYRGLDRFEARRRIVEDLTRLGLIERSEPHLHHVPHGDRSQTPLEPFLTDQWYVRAEVLAKPAIAAVEEGRTRFVPSHWANTYFEWMRNIQPWCISRQLWWGHRIPAWYGPDGTVFVEESEEAALEAARAHYGEEVALEQDPDVLDTWFSSALWPFSTLGWPDETPELRRYYPTDVLVTGFDIIFFWVARMMMMGLYLMKDVPFREVYIHGLIRDERGQKMSKTKGNVIDPLELIDAYGADALRYAILASTAQGRDIRFGRGRVEGYRNFVTKLWNAARFLDLHGVREVRETDPQPVREILNRWIVGETVRTTAQVRRALESYRFNEAAQSLYRFVWDFFCDWWVELAKPHLAESGSKRRQETLRVGSWVLEQVLHLLHPMAPFVSEELWQRLYGGRGGPLIARPWPDPPEAWVDAEADREMGWLIRTIQALRAARTELNVPPRAWLPLRHSGAHPDTLARLRRHEEAIRRLARIDRIEEDPEPPRPGSLVVVVDEVTYSLPVGEVVDLERERARLLKELDRVESELRRLEARLANPDFLERAPAEVVELQRERREETARRRERLARALQAIG